MTPPKDHIIVEVNLSQNEVAKLGGTIINTAKRYNENFREKNPVIALVKTGNDYIKTGDYIICNYSHFDLESPLQITEGVYAVPVDSEIYARVNKDGTLEPVCDNVLVERITKETLLPLPEDLKKPHINQGIISKDAEGFRKDQFVIWLPYADYEIVYMWDGEERRAIKVHKSEIVGILQN